MPRERIEMIPIRVSEKQIILTHPDHIPEIFSLKPLLDDYRESSAQFGKETTIVKFAELLRIHLQTLIQEQLNDPFSQTFFYQVIQDEFGFRVEDPLYPVEPDIIKRAEKVLALNYAQVFLDRFKLEADQIGYLVELLSQDPVLAYPLLKKAGQIFTPVKVEFEDGKEEAIVSNWYVLGMPATEVHPGDQSSLNVYRLVLRKGSNQFLVQTKGYLHSLDREAQIHHFLNADQTDDFYPESDEEFMQRIITLNDDKNQLSPEELLMQLGQEAGDNTLALRLALAYQRQQGQTLDIDAAVEAMLTVLEYESGRFDRHQKKRLKYFMEAIANPLLLGKSVPGKDIIEKYEILKRKPDRQAFLGALLPSIPSLTQRVGSLTMCGLGMAGGGIFTPGQGMQIAHGFGGKLKDTCLRCPSCHRMSTNAMTCTNCGFGRGQSLPSAADRKANFTASQAQNNDSGVIADSLPVHFLPTRESVGAENIIQFGVKDSISPGQIFFRRAAA